MNEIPTRADGETNPANMSAMLCLYKNNVASEVREALESAFIRQNVPPEELIAVFDGPVPEDVVNVIDTFETHVPIRRIVFYKNRGHGPARAAAIEACSAPWIAIIDADDISLPHRFETLMKIAQSHPGSSVVGGGYTEFHMENGQMVQGGSPVLPETPSDVRRFIQSRAPVAQNTAILRVQAIRDVGNYQSWFNNEDYHLWIRLVAGGYEIRNTPESVLLMRTNPNFYHRRGGFKYWWNEAALQRYSLKQGTTTLPRFVFGVGLRFLVQVLLPARLREIFYKKVLRRK